jgi:probable F420-dependent oxidoreductase
VSAPLPVDRDLRIGFIAAMHGPDATRDTARLADDLGYDSLWVGDHIAFPVPMMDPFLQLAQVAAHSERLQLGTSVYLLPLRHPMPTAKQVATLDILTGGRFVFGVGIGGEFPGEFEACEVPVRERGPRLSEAIPLVRDLVAGKPVKADGRFYSFPETQLLPPALQPGGPPIWCGGRAPAALERTGRLADGWISYVVTPERYAEGLEAIAKAAEKRKLERFGTGHLLFMRIDDDYDAALDAATDHLSQRYAMDFRKAAQRYAALGRPADVAQRISEFLDVGLRHIVLDCVGPPRERDAQLERFAREVRPLLPDALG